MEYTQNNINNILYKESSLEFNYNSFEDQLTYLMYEIVPDGLKNNIEHIKRLNKQYNTDVNKVLFKHCIFRRDSLNAKIVNDYEDVIPIVFKDIQFINCVFAPLSTVSNILFDNCRFSNCSFEHNKINNVIFNDCIIKNCTFNTVRISNCSFTRTEILNKKIEPFVFTHISECTFEQIHWDVSKKFTQLKDKNYCGSIKNSKFKASFLSETVSILLLDFELYNNEYIDTPVSLDVLMNTEKLEQTKNENVDKNILNDIHIERLLVGSLIIFVLIVVFILAGFIDGANNISKKIQQPVNTATTVESKSDTPVIINNQLNEELPVNQQITVNGNQNTITINN